MTIAEWLRERFQGASDADAKAAGPAAPDERGDGKVSADTEDDDDDGIYPLW